MTIAKGIRTAAVVCGLYIAAVPAHATFPGQDGRLVYLMNNDTIHLSGHGELVSHGSLTHDLAPTFSPDGSKIAWIRQTHPAPDYYVYVLFVANSDGTGQHPLVSSTQFGVNWFWSMNSTAWTADGQGVSFIVQGNDDESGAVWTAGPTGVTRTAVANYQWLTGGLSWSPVGRELVYPCSFRTNSLGQQLLDLCVLDEIQGQVRQFAIDWPGRGVYVGGPSWTPDGERILFLLEHTTFENNTWTPRSDIFSIDATGKGLAKLSDSGAPVCPRPYVDNDQLFLAVPTYTYGQAISSPNGDSIAMLMWTNIPKPDCEDLGTGPTLPSARGIYTLGANGKAAALLQADSHQYFDWQPVPAKLLVRIDDGHGHLLEGLKVELKQGSTVHVPTNDGGTYAFHTIPPGDYVLRATLVDNKAAAGQPPSFQIHHDIADVEPVWIERNVTVPVGARALVDVSFANSGVIVDSNVHPEHRERLDDMAAIYWRLRQFVDWVKANLTPSTGETVEVRAFASLHPVSGAPYDVDNASYSAALRMILLGTAFSRYEVRDGGGQDEAPENGEWHEFTHHLYKTFAFEGSCNGGNHQGYFNEDTCDSLKEGVCIFFPAIASHDIEGASDSLYAGGRYDLEAQWKAWHSRKRDTGEISPAEDVAVAALLWDLVDPNVDSHATEVVGADGVHHLVTLTDTQGLAFIDIWNLLIAFDPETIRELRTRLGNPDPTVDLDADLVPDIAPLDEVFLMHGFFPVEVEQSIPGHAAYHYDVAAAQRERPGVPRNDDVGYSDHRVIGELGTVLDEFIPRLKLPGLPGANVGFDVLDASGTPLAGATVELTVQYPGVPEPRKVVAQLDSGTAALVPFELPPYFDTFLPVGASLPPCDPLTDTAVEVTVRTVLNGYVSTDTAAFDDCEYQQAIATATGPAALELTATFPEDSLAPTSTILTTPTGPIVDGAALGYWVVRLACDDFEVDGFASGCRRTEYRIDGAELRPYTKAVPVAGLGQHLFEFRSVDGAGNEESFRSVTLEVGPLPDSDGDGLSDPVEIELGTNPGLPDTDEDGLTDLDEVLLGTDPLDPDTDHDGLSDSTEVSLGTSPFSADTDGDGLSDSTEVAAGLDPLDPDGDGDGALDGADTCRTLFNPIQQDRDGDGVGDLCDDCPEVSDSVQTDADADGAGDACDCNPSDPAVRVPASPTVSAAKNGDSTIVLSWPAVAGADDYAITRGDLSGLDSSDFGTCLGHTGNAVSFSDPEIPADGELFLYLVQGQSFACGMGSLGFGAGETQRTNFNAEACALPVTVERQTESETSVYGSVNGNHTYTHSVNGQGILIFETFSSFEPSRHDRLEHRFVVDVAAGDVIELVVHGVRNPSYDGDDMRFEWSTDDTTFTPVSMDSLPVTFDGTLRSGPLPSMLSGPVTIRVVDTDRTPGHDDTDWVFIDWLVVRSTAFGAASSTGFQVISSNAACSPCSSEHDRPPRTFSSGTPSRLLGGSSFSATRCPSRVGRS